MSARVDVSDPIEAGRDGRRARRTTPETVATVVLAVLTVVCIFASRLISPALGSWNQAETVLILGTFLLPVALGQGLVILSGGLDLSVSANFMFGGVMTTSLLSGAHADQWQFLVLIVLMAGVIGCLNGIGIAAFRIPAFMMTMSIGIIVASVALGYTNASPVGDAPALVVSIVKGRTAGVQNIVLIFALVCLIGIALQSRSVFGRHLYAIGGSAQAARVAGVPVAGTLIGVYACSAMLAAISGILLCGYSGGATLTMGDPYLLPSIAAVVVGGSSILGGRGNFVGTIVGICFLGTIDSLIGATGLEQGWRLVISGGVIALALLAQPSSR
ncbi:ABC transporter permease [Caballeronia sp. LZ001]|uniref:ABC transporter permease n=1 Tax=Caballeronia sp. LZ001 TaxID=3038553 RepID=UPI002861A7C1|nr:ABC transporter permease [Caballeronia sp. LZ001]MDR5804793.1 ABC transporter permease [Caballeronia sp. LZ001]